jgi:hypothetical protein
MENREETNETQDFRKKSGSSEKASMIHLPPKVLSSGFWQVS